MGVLQDFERRLEGAVEGFFARTFRSGVQPVELAKAIQRYVEDTQHVTGDGVVVPNTFRFALDPKDVDRLSSYGESLQKELAEVVRRTADDRRWILRGPVRVQIIADDDVAFGMYRLAGKVEPSAGGGPIQSTPEATGTAAAVETGPAVRVLTGGDVGRRVELTGTRMVLGRLPDCAVPLDDATVSREHAALVRRGGAWWVVDLGSTNGTKVNGRTAAELPLSHGDRIELGDAVLEYVES